MIPEARAGRPAPRGSAAVESAHGFDRVADVVIVGSGGAALSAALLAADGGADVLVLERAEQIGGTTAVSGGVVWVPCNRHMAELGVADSREIGRASCRGSGGVRVE